MQSLLQQLSPLLRRVQQWLVRHLQRTFPGKSAPQTKALHGVILRKYGLPVADPARRAMTNEELIEQAAAVLNPHRECDRLFGDVGAALLTDACNL